MSHKWIYSGHQDESAKIKSIYCSKIVQHVSKSYIWSLKTTSEEKLLSSYNLTDFQHPQDIKAFNYAIANSNALEEKEMNNYFETGRGY
jgi:heme-binding NEAT domain protein